MATELYYDLNDFKQFLFEGFQYSLPEDVLNNIKYLESELQIVDNNENVKKTIDKQDGEHYKKKGENKNRNYHSKEITNKDWELIRNFKSTKIETKEGIDKKINDIRVLFNKISNKNFQQQKALIISFIETFLSNKTDEQPDEIDKLSKSIFDIVSTNKFFSELYAELYVELIQHFPIFQKILDDFIVTFEHSIDNIHYIDPNVDYNGYCNYTKINDHRKSITLFIVNMFKKKIVKEEVILDILDYFVKKSVEYIDIENKINEIEEITENIFIIISNSGLQFAFSDSEKWKENILPSIIKISQMKLKEHVSLSNRIIFKYMDIIDSMDC
jgi:hypothetical protein